MKRRNLPIFGLIFVLPALWLSVARPAQGAGEIAVLFEDAQEFNSRPALVLDLGKFHEVGKSPSDFVLFFNLFCEGQADGIGGTEAITAESNKILNENGGGEVTNDMRICEFCQCAGLEGQAFEDCHAANESCVSINNARFVFDPLSGANLLPDPDFPQAVRVLFTMTEHDPPTDCTGRFKPFCDQGTLRLTHHCTHLIDALGSIVKSVSSAYIFSNEP